jgi:hypothetical protein
MMNAIVDSWQKGAISDETKFDLLKKGEVYTPAQPFEEEQSRIKSATGIESATNKSTPNVDNTKTTS